MVPGLLIGGPLDGDELSPGSRGAFVWVSQGPRRRAHKRPAPSRLLYRSTGFFKGQYELWLYAGHTHALCVCGGYNELGEGERNPRCELCGEALTRPSDAPVAQ